MRSPARHRSRISVAGAEMLPVLRSLRTTAAATVVALMPAMLDGAAAQETDLEDQRKPKAGRLARSDKDPPNTFELGQLSTVLSEISVVGDPGRDVHRRPISEGIVTAKEVYTFNKNTLDDAVTMMPGVSASNTGGSRNERLIFVRGFDRFQVPLSIDGIRVYLPADNRLDYGRFLTPDLAEIQVQKGYVSVLNGAGGMGGAINLVTRKPTREFEAELRSGVDIGNRGIPSAFNNFGLVGTRQENYYIQASGTVRDSNGWFLSQNYHPLPIGNGGPIDTGGKRDFSAVQDYRVNVKAAITPNATDEYSISYTKQSGQKGAPFSVFEPVRGITPMPLPAGSAYQRNWRWPYWDIDSIYFLSHTAIGDKSYLVTRAYRNTFNNLLSAYDDNTFSSQSTARSFDSFYDDYAHGGSIEFGTDLIPMNTLRAAAHYRRDSHTERQNSAPTSSNATYEPRQQSIEDTYSLALENNFHATDRLDLVAGVSYDHNKLLKAQEYNSNTRSLFSYRLGQGDAVNWQGAAIYRTSETGRLHASVSSRTRFPNLFERFSTRFGDAEPNPDLKAERATNYEIGFTELFWDRLRLTPAMFYSDVDNAIQSVSIGNGLVQNQNVGKGRYYGYELGSELALWPEFSVGANYTYLIRELDDPARPNLRAIGTPKHQAFVYATWRATPEFSFTPSLEMASGRYSTDRLENNFYYTGGYVLVNLQAQYAFNANTTASVGVRNLLDKNYSLAWGFPEYGRTVFVNLRLTF